MASIQLILTSLALLVFQSDAQTLSQNYTGTWPLSFDKYIILSEDSADRSFSFAKCAGSFHSYTTPLDCNVTVHAATFMNKEQREVTCSLKVPVSERYYSSNIKPVLRRFGGKVSLIWFERIREGEDRNIAVRLTSIYMSNCTSVTSQGISLSAYIPDSFIPYALPTLMYDDGSFDIIVAGKADCLGCDVRYKVGFDQVGKPMSGPTRFQSDFSKYLAHYTEVKSYGNPVNGYWFRGFKDGGFHFRLVNKDGSTRSQLMEFDASAAQEFDLRSSNAHGLYSFCQHNYHRAGPIECFQFDASGRGRLNATLERRVRPTILAVHNLADGGMLLMHLVNSRYANVSVAVRKIDASGVAGRSLPLDFTCLWSWLEVADVFETTDELNFHLACRERSDSVPERLKLSVRRTSKKYLDEMSF